MPNLPSGLFPWRFCTKIIYALLHSPIRATSPAHLIILGLIARIQFGEEYRSKSSSLCSLLHYPAIAFLLRPKIFLRKTILENPQPTLPTSMWDTNFYNHTKQQAKLRFSNILNLHSAVTVSVVLFLQISNVSFDVFCFTTKSEEEILFPIFS